MIYYTRTYPEFNATTLECETLGDLLREIEVDAQVFGDQFSYRLSGAGQHDIDPDTIKLNPQEK